MQKKMASMDPSEMVNIAFDSFDNDGDKILDSRTHLICKLLLGHYGTFLAFLNIFLLFIRDYFKKAKIPAS